MFKNDFGLHGQWIQDLRHCWRSRGPLMSGTTLGPMPRPWVYLTSFDLILHSDSSARRGSKGDTDPDIRRLCQGLAITAIHI